MSIIVKVNGEPITEQLLTDFVGRYIIQLEEEDNPDFEPNDENLRYIKTEVLNFLIERILLLQAAYRDGIEVSAEDVKKNIANMRKNFKDDEEWEKNLLMLHADGDHLDGEIKNDMMVESYLNRLYEGQVKFTEAELKDYFEKNEKFMKEPDLFWFYEFFVPTSEMVKTVHDAVNRYEDIAAIEKEMEALNVQFENHVEIPAYNVPQEVLNILADLEPGKMGTMTLPDKGFLVYKLNRKTIGRKLDYNEIKEKLAEYLIQSGKKEIYAKAISEEMEKANIEYVDVSYLDGHGRK